MRVLKPGRVFRGVLPDLAYSVGRYIADKSESACSSFMSSTGLGTKKDKLDQKTGMSEKLVSFFLLFLVGRGGSHIEVRSTYLGT